MNNEDVTLVLRPKTPSSFDNEGKIPRPEERGKRKLFPRKPLGGAAAYAGI